MKLTFLDQFRDYFLPISTHRCDTKATHTSETICVDSKVSAKVNVIAKAAHMRRGINLYQWYGNAMVAHHERDQS